MKESLPLSAIEWREGNPTFIDHGAMENVIQGALDHAFDIDQYFLFLMFRSLK